MTWACERLPGCLVEAPRRAVVNCGVTPPRRHLSRGYGPGSVSAGEKTVAGQRTAGVGSGVAAKNFTHEQIAGKLCSMGISSFEDAYVCREMIYSAVCALPVVELRKELSLLQLEAPD